MATRDTVMRVRLTGDATGAARAFAEVATEMAKTDARYKQVAEAFIRESDRIEAKAKETANTVAAQQQRFGDRARSASLSRVDAAVGSAPGGGLLGDLGGAEAALGAVGTKAAVATAAVAGLGAAAVSAGRASFQSFTEVGGAVAKFQQTLGVGAEEASRFWYMLSAKGVNPEQGLDALNQFAVNVTQNREELDEFGVTVARFADGTTDMEATLLNVIERYQEMGDSAERARLLSVTLGEEGMRQLQPLLRSTAEELRGLGDGARNMLNEEDLQRLEEWRSAWGKAKADLALLGASIGSDLAPALTQGAELVSKISGELSTMADGARTAAGAFTALSGAVEGLTDLPVKDFASSFLGAIPYVGPYITLGKSIADVATETEKMDWAAQRAAHGGFADLDARVTRAQASMARMTEEDTAAWVEDAGKAFETASDQVESARTTWESASRRLADVEENTNASIEQNYQSTARSIANAQKAVASAQQAATEAVVAAQERVTDAQEAAQEAAEDLSEAQVEADELRVEAAEDAAKRIVDAEKRVADAKERARRQEQDNARDITDAEQAVRDARLAALEDDNPFEAMRRIEEAELDLKRTKEDVAEAQQDSAKEVAEAEQELRDTHVEAAEARVEAEERATEMIESARERAQEANERVGEAIAAVQRAEAEGANRVAEANANLADVTAQAEASRAAAARAGQQQIEAAREAEIAAARRLDQVERELDAARWQRYYADVARLQSLHELQVAFQREHGFSATDPRAYTVNTITSNVPGRAPGRAAGGPVSAGQLYRVNEHKAGVVELFRPSTGGEVIPLGSSAATGGGTGALQPIVIMIGEREMAEVLVDLRAKGYG
jgi:hypothetical protein